MCDDDGGGGDDDDLSIFCFEINSLPIVSFMQHILDWYPKRFLCRNRQRNSLNIPQNAKDIEQLRQFF